MRTIATNYFNKQLLQSGSFCIVSIQYSINNLCWVKTEPGERSSSLGKEEICEEREKCKYCTEAEFMNVQFHWGFRAQSWKFSDLWFLYGFLTIGKGVWFSIRFSSFLLYRNCKRLREFEEIEMSRQSFCTAACVFYEHVSPTAA